MFPEAHILNVDLTRNKVSEELLSAEIFRLYPGGSALALYLILHKIKTGVDPLSPDNILVFAVSPLTGLTVSGLSRMVVESKSPLTKGIGDSQSGGFFPAYLKGNGWDAIVFKGKAIKPVYLYISGKDIQLRSAEHLWGRVTGEAEQILKKELGEEIEVAQIGPAGENLVRYACILSRCRYANGRTGVGAVMGSKNLRAVVVKKTKARKPLDSVGFSELNKNISNKINSNPFLSSLSKYGTSGGMSFYNVIGFLPTRNMSSGWFPEGIQELSTMDNIPKKRDTCFACAVGCKKQVELPSSHINSIYGAPEYETCIALGSDCGISNPVSILISNQLCNMYGIDSISCGATIAFAIECYKNGLLIDKDTGGIKLKFGDEMQIQQLIEMIAKREGIGDLLAEGSERISQKLGRNSHRFVMAVKGLEIPAHMPQYKPALGLIYAVNPFGADHNSSGHDTDLVHPTDDTRKKLVQLGIYKNYEEPYVLDDEKVKFAFKSQCFYSLLDTLCLCNFVWGLDGIYSPLDLVKLCKLGIGWETSLDELMLIGERRLNMMRFFNSREGFNKRDDYLPERFFMPLPTGPSKGIYIDKFKFDSAIRLYYHLAGWDVAAGNPTKKTLRRLSLEWLLGGD